MRECLSSLMHNQQRRNARIYGHCLSSRVKYTMEKKTTLLERSQHQHKPHLEHSLKIGFDDTLPN